jgi:hypothetical protein
LKLLIKGSKGKGIIDDDEFTYNNEFTSKFKRIKVPLISAREVFTEDGAGKSSAEIEGGMLFNPNLNSDPNPITNPCLITNPNTNSNPNPNPNLTPHLFLSQP